MVTEEIHSSWRGAFTQFSHIVKCIEALNLNKSMIRFIVYRWVASVVVCWVSAVSISLCSVNPAGYNVRQQAQRPPNALKTKNQDTNGETYAEGKLNPHSLYKVDVVPGVPICFSIVWDSFKRIIKNKPLKDNVVLRTVLLSAASLDRVHRHYISIATKVPSLMWFFMTQYKRSPVSVLYTLSLWPAVVSSASWNWKLQLVGALLHKAPVCSLSSQLLMESRVKHLNLVACKTPRETW